MAARTLDEYPNLIVSVACRYCKRRGRYRRDFLLSRQTADRPIEEVLRDLSADCTAGLTRTGKTGCNGAYLVEPAMNYKTWRSRDHLLHVICREDEFDGLPEKIGHMGPWIGSREGAVARLKPHYRALLEEQGFVVIYRRPSKFEPEVA